ncbi:hypothetical protein [Maridesulfovibrio sp.]|uniref:CIS tube protein n=1 Tax=Maridesulfovibrio sp. TaxID=2795000 RepID=UPI0039EED3EA
MPSAAKLVKMTIESFDNPKYTGNPYASFALMFNPSSYETKWLVKYDKSQVSGSNMNPPEYNRVSPSDFDLSFTLDGTGVGLAAAGRKSTEAGYVVKELAAFRKATLDYVSDSTAKSRKKYGHPPFCKISWGTFVFRGVLEDAKITHTLFSKEGIPLRAKVSAKFISGIANVSTYDKPEKVLKSIETDSVPGLCTVVSGDPKHFEEVVKENGLRNFRKPGGVGSVKVK